MVPKWMLGLIPRVGAFFLAAWIAWMGWQNLGPRKPEAGADRRRLADEAIAAVVEDLRVNRGEIRDVVLLHFGGDPTDYVTHGLRAGIESNGVLDLRDRTFLEKVRGKLNLRHSVPASADAALRVGRSRGADGVLFGTVRAFESFPGGARLDLEYRLGDAREGSVFYTGSIQRDSSKGGASGMASARVEEVARRIPWFRRLLGWVLLVLLLPVFTIAFIRAMVRKNSNATNGFVLGIYTLADAILAFLLVGAALTSWFPVLVFIAAVAVAFLYNIRIMTFALKLEEE